MRYRILVMCLILTSFPIECLYAQGNPALLTEFPSSSYPYGVNLLNFAYFDGNPYIASESPILQINAPIYIPINFVKPQCPQCVCNDSSPDTEYYTCTIGGVLAAEQFAFEVQAPGAQLSLFPFGTPPGGAMDQCSNSETWASDFGGGLPFTTYFYYTTPGVKTVSYNAYLCTPEGVETRQLLGKFNVTFAIGPALLDPVPNLLSGSAVTTSAQALSTGGRLVQGVVADGVTEVVVSIPAQSADQFSITLINDQGQPSISANEDGALGNTGDTQFSQNQVTVTAGSANGAYYAFAVYRAPIDFARQGTSGGFQPGTCGAVSKTDDQLACRSVSLQIQDISTNAPPQTIPVTVVRPMVSLIHGTWGDPGDWDTFSPLVVGKGSYDPRFSVFPVNYKRPINGTILATDPVESSPLFTPRGNSLGIQYNAPIVLEQIQSQLKPFKSGANPAAVPVAAVQVDVVAHSLGGLIARQMPLLPNFLNAGTFGQGSIHKVITIDTPHLGTPLAIRLLSSSETCMAQTFLPNVGKFVFNSITTSYGEIGGAIGDQKGDGVGGSLSNALMMIKGPGSHPLPTALIAGVYTNFASPQGSLGAGAAFLVCGNNDPPDPLALTLYLNSTQWPAIFNNSPNDAIVPQTSELNGLDPSLGFLFTGFLHSAGAEKLGFSAPSVLDAGSSSPFSQIPYQVIALLNTPVNTPGDFNLLNP